MFKSMFECTHNCAARGSLGSFGIKVGSPCLDSAVEQDAEFVIAQKRTSGALRGHIGTDPLMVDPGASSSSGTDPR